MSVELTVQLATLLVVAYGAGRLSFKVDSLATRIRELERAIYNGKARGS